MIRKYLSLFLLNLCIWSGAPALAQSTVTLGASATSGDGSITTDITWSTSPPLSGTPCTASGHPDWAGAKAGDGSQTITISQSGTLQLQLTCDFPGDSLMTVSWTNPTQNTDGSTYTNPDIVRLKWTFNPSLTTNPDIAAAGENHVDVSQSPATAVRTITGITEQGTARVAGYARNTLGLFSVASNVATKVFQGSVPVTQSVAITVNPIPGPITGVEVL